MQAEAGALGVRLDDDQAARLIQYVARLERWNARFNLISRRDIGRIWPRHILDSLSIAPFLLSERAHPGSTLKVFDIGTGAGLPGLPLAIALPELSWLLIDRNQRKVRFLETVIGELKLPNVVARVADLGRQAPVDLRGGADLIVSRAVDDPAGLLRLADPLLKPEGALVLMTATAAPAQNADAGEVSEASDEDTPAAAPAERPQQDIGPGFVITGVHELDIPGLDRTHEVTIIARERHLSDRESEKG